MLNVFIYINETIAFLEVKEEDVGEITGIKCIQDMASSVITRNLSEFSIHL
jgi:hypothetical protein